MHGLDNKKPREFIGYEEASHTENHVGSVYQEQNGFSSNPVELSAY